jgi:hypothetical protein
MPELISCRRHKKFDIACRTCQRMNDYPSLGKEYTKEYLLDLLKRYYFGGGRYHTVSTECEQAILEEVRSVVTSDHIEGE